MTDEQQLEAVRMGEVLKAVNLFYRRLVELEARVKTLESAKRGGIQGLDGEWTITPPPEFYT
jgi:hypothetical protein